MKYAIAYTFKSFAIIEAENKASAVELLNRMNLAQISEISDGDMIFINSIEEDKDE